MSFLAHYCAPLRKKYQNLIRYAETRAKYQASVVCDLHETLVSSNLFEKGIGYAIFSRKLITGEIAAGVFRLDVFCLGVRTAYANVMDEATYQERIRKTNEQAPLETIHPACCCKLVDQCVHFALNLGFGPHKEYDLARIIFGDVDPGVCPRRFTFGRNGRPTFIPRAEDDADRCQKILNLLKSICGPDGFDYIRE
ncbi:hypothetical protein [Desulfoplanes formicivorans]|uniref:hypothetical protein n=1 Tax=Desulfoplanes formicivorans TaxID=1592317 RepID=UPI000853E250|nr:hypothetical protein [Desulfoplanes formicivorans]